MDRLWKLQGHRRRSSHILSHEDEEKIGGSSDYRPVAVRTMLYIAIVSLCLREQSLTPDSNGSNLPRVWFW